MMTRRLIATIVFAGFADAAAATPALAEDWHHDRDRHWHDRHWHDPHVYGGPAVVVAPQPPVVYAAPPVIGLGLDFRIR